MLGLTWLKHLKTSSFFRLVPFLILVASCFKPEEGIAPQIQTTVKEHHLKQLPSAFSTPSSIEEGEPWAQEYLIGQGFAKELDLYQSLTAFKRASFLNPPSERLLELNYKVYLNYYLGQRYLEAISVFENSELRLCNNSFPAYSDLLITLYDAYFQVKESEKAQRILQFIQQADGDLGRRLALSEEIRTADLHRLSTSLDPSISKLYTTYQQHKKSVAKARTFNALLPGAGYYYLGQKQSALTAFLLNSLFIWGAAHFYHHHNYAAGMIMTSFEMGWYFGGIYGAGLEAKFYNERLFEKIAHPVMQEKKLLPLLMLNHAF
jgi:hypothetical protein